MSESINNFIKNELEMMFSKFRVMNPSVDVYIESVRARTPLRHPVYACELIYKSDFNRTSQKVIREGRDLFTLISDGLLVIEQSLTEQSSRKNDHRRFQRRETKREFARLE